MNKYRKAESRKVKVYVRKLRAVGCDISYKKARRHIRNRDRAMRDLPRNVRRGLRKGIKRCDYGVSRAIARIAERAIVMGQALRSPVGISAVAESLASYQEVLTEQKLSEDRPKRTFRRTNYIFLDESTPMEETPALWPKENPHMKRGFRNEDI